MTLDEKLHVFYDSTIADATRQSEEILEEYKASLESIYEEHKKAAQEKAAFTLEVESQKLIQEKNKNLSIKNLEFKRLLNEKTEELKGILFEDIISRLHSFMKTEEYTALLIEQINLALDFAKGDEMTIYINPSDEGLKGKLEEKTGFLLTVSNIDFMGGTRAVIHERNILIDRSFSTRLSEEKEIFSL